MLEIINCVLASPGVEIHIPAGVYLLPQDEMPIVNGITLVSHDESYRMIWQINEDDEGNTEEGITQLLEDIKPRCIVRSVTPITVNGLSGHCAAYNDTRCGNYEARFSLPDNQQVYFYIITETGVKIETVMDTPEFQAALNAVRKAD